MELSRQKQLVDSFYTWYDTGLKGIVADNRRRYRMQMLDGAEREERGLSALPSTKSASVSDRFREKALLEYHENIDSISYTSKALNDITKEELCRWLTEIFIYRSQNTFPFFSWHSSSLLACAVDGIEAAMVWWRREAIQKTSVVMGPLGMPTETTQSIPVRDTWWIDQLMPGRDVVWDPKIPYLDVNLGQYAMVKLRKSLDECSTLSTNGVFDIQTDFSEHQTSGIDTQADWGKTARDVDQVDLGDKNLIEVWCFFFKENNEWLCQFSLGGTTEISTVRPVNDIFFGGRQVNRLPVVVGTMQ